MTPLRRARWGSIAAVVITGMAGCGIPAETTPRTSSIAIGVDLVGEDLMSGTDDGTETSARVAIYLIDRDGTLVPSTRTVVSAPTVAARTEALIDALIDGPTDAEAARGVRSAVPSTTSVLGVDVVDGVVTVDLSGAFASIGGARELSAVGQLVLSATPVPSGGRFALRIDGRPTAVPLPDGVVTSDPVDPAEYGALLDPAR